MAHDVVLEVLDGCAHAAAREAGALGEVRIHGRTELHLRTGDLAALRGLRTVVAASVRIAADGHRPRVLLETSVMQRVRALLEELARIRPRRRFSAVRLAAAGADTPDMQRIAAAVAEAAGVSIDQDNGDLLVRVRRAGTKADPTGWELLLRTTPRPLATRAWRTVDYPGAVNATIAATCLDLLQVGEEDSLLDMTCGSGTFLIEQLLRGAPRRIVGIDIDAAAIDAAQQHQRAARRKGRIDWIVGDAVTEPLTGTFTRIITNPPWGMLHGDHETNQELLADLMDRAAVVAAPGARLGVLTHEIRRMHAVIEEEDLPWRQVAEHRFFQKGHHPRLFLFER